MRAMILHGLAGVGFDPSVTEGQETFVNPAPSLMLQGQLGVRLLRVCESRCQKCGAAMTKGLGLLRCEKCESEARARRKLDAHSADKAAVEMVDMGDFEPEGLPKTG